MANLNSTIQESLLALVCFDPDTFRVALSLASPKVYDPIFRDLAEAASSYIDKWDKPPGEHTLDLVHALGERKPDIKEDLEALFGSLYEVKDGINSAYVIDQAKEFKRSQNLHSTLSQAVKLMAANGSTDEIDELFTSYLKPEGDGLRTGTRMWNTDEALAFFDAPVMTALPTGIAELDEVSMGPAPGRLHLFLGPTGAGKSWWLLHLAKQSMLIGKRVLMITCEMPEEEVMHRVMQNNYAITKRPQDVIRPVLEKRDGKFEGLSEKKTNTRRPSMQDEGIKETLERKLAKTRKNKLICRFFPAGTLNVRGIEAYLDVLETAEGFIPDLILIDYLDLLETDPNNLRISLKQLSINLKGLAAKRNVAVATATQANGEAANKTTMGLNQISEDKSKGHTADTVITYNQTVAEHARGLARLFVAKGRSDKDKFTVIIAQSYTMGQFALDSVGNATSYMDHMRDED